MTGWASLTDYKKMELLRRKYINKEDIGVLAAEIGMKSISLNRRLQELRAEMDDEDPEWVEAAVAEQPKANIEFPREKGLPSNQELFEILRKGPVSIRDLSKKFDRSETTIWDMIDKMESAGYVLERTEHTVAAPKKSPKIEYKPSKTLADEAGHEITFGVISDTHFGSAYVQASALQSFMGIAYDAGVRHVFHAGDLTAGINGYKGQEFDLLPTMSNWKHRPWIATEQQIWLADQYLPKMDGLTYYILGGNHDYWHIVSSGIDAVSKFCQEREDCVFLGYDVADVPITDRVELRLWHPSGGVPYALSYRLQKGLEQLAFEELSKAVEQNENPKVRFLIGGHLHVEAKFHRGPMVAALAGCFEGQTNYLKKKALLPTIGGSIWNVIVTDTGLVKQVDYTFIPFNEIESDWENFPVPEENGILEEPDEVEVLFQLH
jgi:biotin operon repressor